MGVLNKYYGKELVATLSINEKFGLEENTLIYVYPSFVIQGAKLIPIDPEDFPNSGCFEARLYGGSDAQSIFTKYGRLVTVKINAEPSMNYTAGNNLYFFRYNQDYGKDRSEIWIEEFKGFSLYQVIDSYKNFSTIEKDRFISEPSLGVFTNYILIRHKDKMYGPFDFERRQGSLYLKSLPQYDYLVGEYSEPTMRYQIFDVEDQFGNIIANFIARSAINDPKDDTNHDWLPNEAIIDIFAEIMRTKYSYNRDMLRQVKELASNVIDIGAYGNLSEQRLKKIKEIAQFVNTNEKYSEEYLKKALQDNSLEQELFERYFKSSGWDSSILLKESPIEQRIKEAKNINNNNDDALEMNEDEGVTEYESLSQLIAAKTEVVVDNSKIEELTQECNELKETNSSLQEQLNDLQERAHIVETKEQLTAQTDALRLELEQLQEQYQHQLDESQNLADKLDAKLLEFNDPNALLVKALESKLMDRVMHSVGNSYQEACLNQEEPLNFDSSILSKDMNAAALIDRVSSFLNDKAHRHLSNNDIANYLICLSQGFMTTFAGEPGTGKTSLCNLLAKSLGLATGNSTNRFVEISVERGWTSHKDFIGYYNPLTKSLEKSNVDAFNAFELMSKECVDPYDDKQIAPFIMLLDEANLSPMEHYWAVFLKNCDLNSSTKKVISLGGNNNFNLPPHLRFLATVNFDHTTEELSPRYLDRSWVIYLDPNGYEQDFGDDETILNAKSMVPFGSLVRAFGIKEKNDITDEVAAKWSALQDIFANKCAMPITPRNLKMVRHYCNTACRCMDLNGQANKLAPIDYAFSQKILPIINGSGDQYKTLIEALIAECPEQSMPITAMHLERMNRLAKNNMGFYQFFAR